MHKFKCLAPGWVYSLADYRQMFDLDEADLAKRILDYPGGISSFNVEMKQLGHRVVSGDSAYDLDLQAMDQHYDEIMQQNISHLEAHVDTLQKPKPQEVKAITTTWTSSGELFLQDYLQGKKEGRYQYMNLPELPFSDHEFQLALCSDALFHTQVGSGFSSRELIAELLRVAEEVRVFPLLNEVGEVSEEVGPVMLHLQQQSFGIEVRQVSYRLRKGGNAMLRIWATKCKVA